MRKENWRVELIEYLRSLKSKSFQWEQNDCCSSVFNGIEVMTGNDFVAHFRGKYSTELGSSRLLKKNGYDSIDALATDLLGPPLENPNFAAQGDVATVDIDGIVSFGIVFGPGIYCVSEEGLNIISFEYIKTAWRVE